MIIIANFLDNFLLMGSAVGRGARGAPMAANSTVTRRKFRKSNHIISDDFGTLFKVSWWYFKNWVRMVKIQQPDESLIRSTIRSCDALK